MGTLVPIPILHVDTCQNIVPVLLSVHSVPFITVLLFVSFAACI